MITQLSHYLILILGIAYFLVLPGLALSFALFTTKEVDLLQRLALALALSLAALALTVFGGALLGIKVERFSVIIETLAIILFGLGVSWWRHHRQSKGASSREAK